VITSHETVGLLGLSALERVAVEPFVGGRMLEVSTTGKQCTWGRVLTWEPPSTFAFSWLIGPDWAVPAPDAKGSRVTVTFTATDDGTHVELVHDQLDAHGEGWETERDSAGGAEGWGSLLARFAATL
jgi:uncharacterized protein YndB with AHSA1/START domain